MKLAPKFDLPDDVASQAVAILGVRGSGKTNTAVCLVEELHGVSWPFAVIDPTNVWWGLKSSADGKSEGLAGVVVFGGEHGDLPLEREHGELLADFVVDYALPCVFSLRHLPKAGQKEFVRDFATRLYFRKGQKPGPLSLIIDECDTFIPQRVGGAEAVMVGAIEDLVRRGRAAGIGVVLISQRAASVNKDVLTQCETLIAHRHVGPQDRHALEEWVEAHDSAGHQKTFMATLASLGRGEAWIWSPTLDVFQRVQVRTRRTFDSSATPKPGARVAAPTVMTKPDLEALRAKLGEAIKQATATDPKVLQVKLRELEKVNQQLREQLNAELRKPMAVTPEEISDLRRQVQVVGHKANKYQAVVRKVHALVFEVLNEPAAKPEAAAEPPTTEPIDSMSIPYQEGPGPSVAPGRAYATPTQPSANGVSNRPKTVSVRDGAARPLMLHTAGGGNRAAAPAESDLSGPETRCLEAFLWYELLGIEEPTDDQLCYRLGYSPNSSTISVILSKLRRNGYIEGRRITVAGRELADPPDIGSMREFHDQIRSFLDGTARRVFETCLAAHPRELSAEAICKAHGWSATSSTLSVGTAALRRAGLMEKRSHRLTPAVFPEALR